MVSILVIAFVYTDMFLQFFRICLCKFTSWFSETNQALLSHREGSEEKFWMIIWQIVFLWKLIFARIIKIPTHFMHLKDFLSHTNLANTLCFLSYPSVFSWSLFFRFTYRRFHVLPISPLQVTCPTFPKPWIWSS